MANNNGNGSGGGGATILVILCIVGLLALLGSCSSNNDDLKDTLNSGMQKYENGEPMTREEYNTVHSYLKWEDNQRDKTYNEWNK